MSLPWAITQAQGIQRIAENGRTVVIVAQNAYATLSVSHFGHLLEDGWVALSGPPEELLSNDYVAISDPATVIRPGPGLLRAAVRISLMVSGDFRRS